MWKLLSQSVAGARHVRDGAPCQDCCLTACELTVDESVLVAVCADGAGSARLGEIGARLACETVVEAVRADLREGQTILGLDADAARYWLSRVRAVIEAEAGRHQATPRDLACTLLLAVVGESAAAFVQLGDGAIVVRQGEDYWPIFWPEAGEYANDTHFVTDPDASERLAFALRPGRLEELALLTDGLQRLALDLTARTGHRPFFAPLFQRLRAAPDAEALAGPLRQFLTSPRVAQRSDDDLTLVLATRVPPRADADAV